MVPEADLEDVAHVLFIAVYRHLPEYDPTRPIQPWLYSFIYWGAKDYRRRARHQREEIGEVEVETEDEAPTPERRLMIKEDQALVIEALSKLSLEQRAVLVMHDIEGHTAVEIAEALSIPTNTVSSRLRLARNRFESVAQKLLARREAP